MKRSKFYPWLLAVLAVASLLSWNVYSAEKKSTNVVWEYKLFSWYGDNTNQLSKLGNEGWELTSVRTEEETHGGFHQTRVYYYLKRAQKK